LGTKKTKAEKSLVRGARTSPIVKEDFGRTASWYRGLWLLSSKNCKDIEKEREGAVEIM